MSLGRESGASLMELLLAGVLVTGAVVALSAVFPKASNNMVSNQRRWMANQLANSQIQNLQSQPYAYVDATDKGSFQAANAFCDCTQDDYSLIPSTVSTAAGTTFAMKSCVNFVDSGGAAACPPPLGVDTGYKSIKVRVSWTAGTDAYYATTEAVKIRD